MKKIRFIGIGIAAAVWAALTLAAWFAPKEQISEAERRQLAQMPELTVETLLSGEFMADFEDFTLDQFPLRDSFRQIKALFHYYVLGQKDNNGIYIADGFAAVQEYPLDQDSLDYAVKRFTYVYDRYLANSDCRAYMAIVPDKGYYLGAENGQLVMDYDAMFRTFAADMPWAAQIDLTGSLTAEDYYRTDTHWRQERLLEAAGVICDAMGAEAPQEQDYTLTALDRPFYGVYYGQAALPMEPETMYILESSLLEDCTVYDWESGTTGAIYDMSKLESKDLYDVFLSGSRSLLTIENPAATTDRELVIFRDSFGSAIAPLLVQDYAKVTLVDIRYIQIDVLDRFLEFDDQDVLFLYSTLVLNNSSTIK